MYSLSSLLSVWVCVGWKLGLSVPSSSLALIPGIDESCPYLQTCVSIYTVAMLGNVLELEYLRSLYEGLSC